MTAADMTFMAEKYQARPRERLGAFLRQMYPGVGRDKRLANDLRISPKAARNLFEDHWPGDETFAAILRQFGQGVWRVVCAPEIAPVLAEIQEREAHLARELQAIQARKREVAGFDESRSFALAGDQDQDEPLGPPNLDLFEAQP